MKLKQVLGVVMLMSCASPGWPAPLTATGYVKSVDVQQTGDIMVTMREAHDGSQSCGDSSMVAIPRNHRAKKEMLAVVLSAQATGAQVNFGIDGCYTSGAITSAQAVTAAVISE